MDQFDSTIPDFLAWEEKVKVEIESISEILSGELSDEPTALIEDLTHIEGWNSRCGALLAEANSLLSKFKLEANPEKENLTEADRKIILEAACAPIVLVRDTLEHFCDCIKQRIILGESILRYEGQFIDPTLHTSN